MKIKNIIFDWSGTLCDDVKSSYLATKHTIRHFGGPHLTFRQYREQFDLPVWKFYKKHCPTTHVNEIDKYYFNYFARIVGAPLAAPRYGVTRERAQQARAQQAAPLLFKQIPQILKTAQAMGLKLFIYSTVRQDLLEKWCHRHHIKNFFEVIGGSVRDKERGLKSFCRRYGLKAKETLFIGDMEHDVRAAKKAGVLSGAMLCGYHAEKRLLDLAPDFVWNDLQGLMKFVCTLMDGSFDSAQGPQRFPVAERSRSQPIFPIPTVGALIFNKEDILLIQTHKWSHTFGIPGGKIKQGETMNQALKREILEETGLRIKEIRFAMVHDSIDSQEFYKKGKHFLLLNFYAISQSRHVVLNDEAQAFVWVSLGQALKLRLNHPTRVLIQHYLKS